MASGLLAARVTDDQRLWRRVQDNENCLWWDANESRWRPQPEPPSNAVQIDDDGISMFLADHLEQVHQLGPEIVLAEAPPGYRLVYEISVQFAMTLNAGVEWTPTATSPPGCAHTSVTMDNLSGTRNEQKAARRDFRLEMAMAMDLVFGTPRVTPPPGA